MNIYLALILTILFLSGGCLNTGSDQDTTTPPPTMSPILALADVNGTVGANTANITWTTNVPSDSMVRYGMESGKYNMSEGSKDYVTEHSIILEGLIPGTTYYCKIGSVDPDGTATQSREYSFTTLSLPLPIISSVSASPSSTKVLIKWKTDIPSDSKVGYSTIPGGYSMYTESADYVTDHRVTITKLLPGSTYYYTVGSTGSNNVFNESEEFEFETEPARLGEKIVTDDLEITLRNFGVYTVKKGDILEYYSRAEIAIKNIGEEKIPLTITSTSIVDSGGYQSDRVLSIGAPDDFKPTEVFPGGKIARALYYEKMSASSGTLYMSINSKPYQFHVR